MTTLVWLTPIRSDYDGAPDPGPRRGHVVARVTSSWLQSGFFLSRFIGRIEQLDRVTRHDGRYGVLVDELRVPVPPQENAEVIEPRYNAL
jgi:hypothetical protein